MPIQFSPDDFQNNDFQLAQDNAGDLVLEHKQTGGRFKFDATTDSWVPVQGLDLQGADIVNVGASKTNFTEKADLTSSNGVLQSSQLPDLAITNIDVVANQSERLSLTAEEGDVAVQTDVSQTFILATNDPTVDSNWKQVQLDVLGAIDGQTITPAQTGTSTNRTDVVADTVDANQLTGVSTGGIKTKTRAFLKQGSSDNLVPFDRVSYDPDNNFDTNTHEYIVPADGTYHMGFNARIPDSVPDGDRVSLRFQRGETNLTLSEKDGTGDFSTISATDIRELKSGDSITVNNRFGTNLRGDKHKTFMFIVRLA